MFEAAPRPASTTTPGPATPLRSLPVLLVDCQATGSSPKHGDLIEVAWALARAEDTSVATSERLVALPKGVSLGRRVSQLTGLSQAQVESGVSPQDAISVLRQAWPAQAPAVAHFARFEKAFLTHHGVSSEREWLCTHALVGRLLPDLPKRTMRAVAGYFGEPLGLKRRSGPHVAGTLAIWRGLVALLEQQDVHDFEQLRGFLSRTRSRRSKRVFPLPRAKRLALPDEPGVYRMLGRSGEVLYVGKATSLKKRVNSWFRSPKQKSDRELELLCRAADLDVSLTGSPLEAALLETDEVKRLEPIYNKALRRERLTEVCFARRDLSGVSERPDVEHPLGPFPAPGDVLALGELLALSAADIVPPGEVIAGLLGMSAGWGPRADIARTGWEQFQNRWGLRSLTDAGRLGASLWALRDAEDPDEVPGDDAEPRRTWSADGVADSLEKLVMRSTHLARRAGWLVRLVDAELVWQPRGGGGGWRRVSVMAARPQEGRFHPADQVVSAPGGRPDPARCFVTDPWAYDRLRVLTTELRALASAGHGVRLRLGPGRPLDERQLRARLAWF